MREMSRNRLSYLLSLAVDGVLSDEEAKELNAYVHQHPEAKKELEELRSLKQLLGRTKPIQPNPFLWTRIAQRLKEHEEERENLLPFPRKLAPAAAAFGVLLFLAAGVFLIENRPAVEEYLSQKSNQVKQAYEDNILKGSIVPLLRDLDNDRILQFAMFGSLPLDKKEETALRIDESSQSGYRIELGKGRESVARKVTMEKFLAEVKPTPVQRKAIDSLLDRARQRIETAVLVSGNNALAVDPELPRLNRVVLSGIAECLEPSQRVRLEQFLQEHRAPYAIEVRQPRVLPKTRTLERGKAPEKFIVITPDTFAFTTLPIVNEGFERDFVAKTITEREGEIRIRVEQLTREFQRRHAEVKRMGGVRAPQVQVWGDEGTIEIQLESAWDPMKFDSMHSLVKARRIAPRIPRSVEVRSPAPPFMHPEMKTESDTLDIELSQQDGDVQVKVFKGTRRRVVQAPKAAQRDTIY